MKNSQLAILSLLHLSPLASYPPINPGTYWYHSHSGLQEQRGLLGSIVILPKEKQLGKDRDHVVVLSDWTNQNPTKILRNLRRGSEYFGAQKKTAPSGMDHGEMTDPAMDIRK